MKPIKNCYKFYENAFSDDERLKFLNEINFSNIEDETIEDKQTNTAKRKVKKISVQNDNWFVKKIRSYTKKANDELWNFDLNFDQIEKNTLDANEILMYDEQSFYEYHTDHTSISSKLDLKITTVAFLNEGYTGGQFNFMLDGQQQYFIKTKCFSVLVYPCYMMHQVSKIESGKRLVLLLGSVGPKLK
jgi:predicted 2-oxoglutarate/Fe(II)-dependent dioxygenase YbiX